MLSRWTAHVRGVPNLVVARRVINKMVAAAQRFAEDETGEAMVGLVVPGTHTNGVPTLYVLDTISPDETAVRQMHTFQQGDERQDELIWWLQENWRVHREHERQTGNAPGKWDVPLRYLGDWHKQPGHMIQPSSGDLMTALDWIDDPDNGMDFLLAPIVTLDHYPTTLIGDATVNFVTVPQGDGLNARIDFWYIDRETRLFLPVTPAVYPDDQLPSLVAYPWHLLNEARFSEESARLTSGDRFATLVLWEADDAPPLEICFLIARVGADRVLLVVTPWNYPHAAPWARVAPYVAIGENDDVYRIFEQLWQQSEPVEPPEGWQWNDSMYLIDFVRALEEKLGLAETKGGEADQPPHEEASHELGQS